mmetsp:Transcript_42516/g.83590  ORF Transcript_42516/g.83590 Transcript_42516/m.83590 type:complete len:120 (-) Transcript_42516:321-680(-)
MYVRTMNLPLIIFYAITIVESKNDIEPHSGDICWNGKFHETCRSEAFPVCSTDEHRCYYRTNRRDRFYADQNPYFYIDYEKVLCYGSEWECSTCTPGRYCLSEERCILDPNIFDCSKWL